MLGDAVLDDSACLVYAANQQHWLQDDSSPSDIRKVVTFYSWIIISF